MTNSKLITIRNIFQNKLEHEKVEVQEEVMYEKCIELNIIPNFLRVYISDEDITVSYKGEFDEFWKSTYSNNQEWINAASKHTITIATHKIVIDSYYNKITQKLLFYKIWIIEKNNRKRLLKRVSITPNLIDFFSPKTVVTQTLKESKA